MFILFLLQFINLVHYSLIFALAPIVFFYMDMELPPVLSEYPLWNIYNFDESGLAYKLLATSGNVLGAAKDRRGAELANDMITVGNL